MSEAPSNPDASPDPVPEPVAALPPRRRLLALKLGLIFGTPLLVLVVLALRPRRVDVLVHNGHEVPVVVSLGGESLRPDAYPPIAPHDTLRVSGLRAGPQVLWCRVGEGAPRRLEVSLEADFARERPAYVWDVGGGGEPLWVVWRGYGTARAPSPRPFALGGEVAPVPSDVLPRLDASFPAEIREPKGSTGGVRAVLWSDHYADLQGPRRAVVWVDNRSQAPLHVSADGQPPLVVGPLSVYALRLPRGPHTLEAKEVGAAETVISEHRLQVDLRVPPLAGEKAWAWCPVGEPDYLIRSRSYGDYPEPLPAPEPFRAEQPLFPLPDDLVPALNAFPAELSLPRGTGGALRRSLFTPDGRAQTYVPGAGIPEQVIERVRREAQEQAPGGAPPPGGR